MKRLPSSRSVGTRLFVAANVWWYALCFNSANAAPSQTSVNTATYTLNWVRTKGADDCITARTLAQAVEARLGKAVFVSSATADIAVEGHVSPREPTSHVAATASNQAARGYRATIKLTSNDGKVLGERVLDETSGDCRAMDKQLSLIIALMIDADAVSATEARRDVAPPPRKHAEPAVTPTPTQIIKTPEAKQAHRSAEVAVRLGPAVSLGAQPDAGAGGRIGVGLKPPDWAFVWFDAFGFLATSDAVAPSGEVEVQPWWLRLAVEPVAARFSPSVQLTVPMGAWAGRFHADASDFTVQSGSASSWSGGPFAGVNAVWNTTDALALFVEGTAYVPLNRPDFVATVGPAGATSEEQQDSVFHVWPIFPCVSIGAQFHF